MAQLIADFRARADAYKAEIAAAAKAMDDLPKAQQRVAQRMQAIAAKATDDQVKLRELAVIKEIRALQKLASKTPELYHQAEQAKKQILERAAQERIAIEERAAATMSQQVQRLRPHLTGIVQLTNSVGSAVGTAASQFTGMATGVVASLQTGGPVVAAIGATSAAVVALIAKFREAREAAFKAREAAIAEELAREQDVDEQLQRLQNAVREKQASLGRAPGVGETVVSSAEYAEARARKALTDATTSLANAEAQLERARRAAAGGARGGDTFLAQATAAKQQAETALSLAETRLALAKQQLGEARDLASFYSDLEGEAGAGKPAGGPEGGGGGRGGGTSRARAAGTSGPTGSPYATRESLAAYLKASVAEAQRQDDFAALAAQEKQAEDEAKVIARARAEAENKEHKAALAKEAKSEAYVKAGLAAGAQFATGFAQAMARGDGSAPSIFKIFSSVLGTLLGIVNPAAGAAFGAITGLLPFRAGGAPGLPQGRGGLGAGVNFDARLAHFDHPEEWKLSRQAVAGLGGVDAAARLNRDAAAGRLGRGGQGNVTLVLPTLLPSDAAAAVRQAVRPGLETIMSNWQSGALRHDLQRYSDRARAS